MIPVFIINGVVKLLLKQFKLDKILDYVENPNELDKQVEVLQKNLTKMGKDNEERDKNIAIIMKDSHPPRSACLSLEQINEIFERLRKIDNG